MSGIAREANPQDHLLAEVVAAMSRVLGQPIEPDADFFAQGGDSLAAAEVAAALEVDPDGGLALGTMFRFGSTPALVALGILAGAAEGAVMASALTIREPSGPDPQMVWLTVHPRQLMLAREVTRRVQRPVGVRILTPPPPLPGKSLSWYVDWFRGGLSGLRVDGPIWLVGACFGPMVATELARSDPRVEGIVALDPIASRWTRRARLAFHLQALRAGPGPYLRRHGRRRLQLMAAAINLGEGEVGWDGAAAEYRPDSRFDGLGVVIRTTQFAEMDDRTRRPWPTRFGTVTHSEISGHHGMLYEPSGLDVIATTVEQALVQARHRAGRPAEMRQTA